MSSQRTRAGGTEGITMQIQTTEASIAMILTPTEARHLLERLNGLQAHESIGEIQRRLSEFVDGPCESCGWSVEIGHTV